LPRRDERIESGAASEVQDSLAGLQFGDGLRIPATETEVRSFGGALSFILRITESARTRLIAGATATRAAAAARRSLF
jgi:hypothetical protein